MAKKSTKSKGRTPEAQAELPGVLDKIVKIPALTRILKRYLSARTAYAEWGKKASDEKVSAVAMMKEHGLELYPVGEGYFRRKPGKESLEFVEDGHHADADDGDGEGSEE